jgi:hypothetical protein
VRWLREHWGWVAIFALFFASLFMVEPRWLQAVGFVLWFTAFILLLRRLDQRTKRSRTEV